MEEHRSFWKRKEIVIGAVIAIVALLIFPTIVIVIILQDGDSGDGEVLDLSRYIWESMDGPPGGGFTTFAQNPYHPDELYAGVPLGLYLSRDRGMNFVKVGDPAIRNVTDIHFTEDMAVIVADQLYSYEYSTGASQAVYDRPLRIFTSGNDVYLVDLVPHQDKFEASFHKVVFSSPTYVPVLDGSTLITTQQIDMDADFSLLESEFFITALFAVEDDILISIGVINLGSGFVYDIHDTFLVNEQTGQLEEITPPHIDGFTTATIEQDPENERHLLVGARSKKANDDFSIRTLDKLVFESFDGGRTWVQFTSDTNHSHSVVKDINFGPDGIYFGRVGDHILKVDPSDHETIQEIDMTHLEDGKVFWAEWIEFDLEDPKTVYAGLDLEFGATGFLRSTDSMSTWEIAGKGVPSSSPSIVIIHPFDGSIIATAGNIAHFPHITRDGGENWELLTPKTTLGDEIIFDPHDPDHMILVNEGALLFESWDMGRTWDRSAEEFTGTRVFDIETTEEGTSSVYASCHGTGISRMKPLDLIDTYVRDNETYNEWKHLLNCPDYVYDIEIDPDNSEIIYATYSPKIFENHSSIWKYDSSQDELRGWSEILKVPNSAGATSIAIDPSDPDRMYAGITGEPGRIYMSDDRGDEWELLADQLTFSTIHEMAVDPTDDSIVFAAPWGGGLWKSSDSAATWELLDTPTTSISSIVMDEGSDHMFIGDRTRPAVYETDDGGKTWHKVVEFDIDLYYRVSAMALHQGQLYVSLFNIEDNQISVYNAGPMSGTTFRMEEVGPVELAGEMKRAVIGFATNGEELYAVSHIRGVYELQGDMWTDISAGLPDMGFNGINVDEDMIYLAGGCDVGLIELSRLRDPNIVNNIYTSSNGGATWTPMLDDDPFKAPIKKVAPLDNGRLIAGTNSGVYISADSGASWTPQNNGLDFQGIGSMSWSSDTLYAGTLGGGVFKGEIEDDDTISWATSEGPFPHIFNIQIKVDPGNSDTVYATAFPGGVFKSIDRGLTWNECNFALPSFEVTDPLTQGYYSLEIDPENPEKLFLGIYNHGVYVSRDGAATWYPMYAIYRTDPVLKDLGVRRVKFDPSNNRGLYMVSDQGVFRSTDSGESWTTMNNGLTTLDILSIDITESGTVFVGTNGYGVYKFNGTRERWVHLGRPIGTGQWAAWERRLYQYTALLFDPDIEGRVYLGQFPGGFFISEDNGETWECSSSGLGNDGIFSLTMHPGNQDVLFAGTYNGVWRSENRGRTWSDTSRGMPTEQWPFCVVIDDEEPNIMYTATKNGQNKGFMERNTFGGVVMRSIDGGMTWEKIMNGLVDLSEYYQIIIHPEDHDILFLSSSYGVFISLDGGDSWDPFNNGMPEKYFYVRDNVAQNLKITPDMRYLVMAITGFGVWRVDISDIAGS
ncbi:MAG: WD40/YVTN/BNR-like repeat-containing protein [Thermoplasmatota archaeon]